MDILSKQLMRHTFQNYLGKVTKNQHTLADLSGVAVNTIVAIERGVGNPHLQTILAVLDTLGLRVDLPLK